MAFGVIRQLLFKVGDKLRPLGARTDEAHLTLQDIPCLRQFVDADLADEFADPGDARIVERSPHRISLNLGIASHRPQFEHAVGLSKQPNADLTIERRSLAFQLHQDREQNDDRHSQRQQN